MRYLMREGAPLTATQWDLIDKAVVAEAKKILVGRRFLSLAGPLGAQTQNVPLDVMENIVPASADFWGRAEMEAIDVAKRRFLEIATVYADFKISWRDIENEGGAGVQAAMDAAVTCARREDDLVFFGDKDLGIDGIFTAKGSVKVPISDWTKGENPLSDVAKAIELLCEKGCAGDRVLVVSTDLYGKLHRIQPGTGMMEIDRVAGLVGKLLQSPRLEKNKAALVYSDAHNLDLVVGQDLITAYMGNEKMDHAFRVMETIVPRIKRPSAIAILG